MSQKTENTKNPPLDLGVVYHFNKRHCIVEKSQDKKGGFLGGSKLWEGKYMGEPMADRVIS